LDFEWEEKAESGGPSADGGGIMADSEEKAGSGGPSDDGGGIMAGARCSILDVEWEEKVKSEKLKVET